MRLALMTEPQLGGSYQDLLRAARLADQAGLDFARSDHYYWRDGQHPVTDAFTSIGGLARETASARLAVLVSPITFRHPAVLAKAAATLDEMSGGRFDLGLGTGWMREEHDVYGLPFPSSQQRYRMLEEAFAYLGAAFAGRPFSGELYNLAADAYPRPRAVRLIAGGSGPERTPHLAGRLADEYNMFAMAGPDLAVRIERARAAAAAAGRDPDHLVISIMGPALIARSRRTFEESLAAAAGLRGVSPADLQTRWEAMDVPMGTPEQAGEALSRLAAAGVSKFYLQWLDLADHRGIELMVEAAAAVKDG
jgi:alkanesulfonate monooxygenase SsuD/methylene tetrahydromethanopterin reductase-like flavin-dependent oxidoreductase (luciferase family)